MAEIQIIKATILDQLSDNYIPPYNYVIGLTQQLQQLENKLVKTVIHNNAFSELLIGMRGTGKSLALKVILKKLRDNGYKFLDIHLNGRLHVGDKAVIREIARRLARGNGGSSVGEILPDGLQSLGTAFSATGVPIIIILDEFDIFAQTQRNFVYSLVNTQHTVSFGIIGISARADVIELLEKRAKSRFSQSAIVFPGISSASEICDVLKHSLQLPTSNKLFPPPPAIIRWNENINCLCSSIQFREYIGDIANNTTDMRVFLNMMSLAVVQVNTAELKLGDVVAAYSSVFPDSHKDLIRGLPSNTLGLLLAVKNVADIHPTQQGGQEEIMTVDRIFQELKTNTTNKMTYPQCTKELEALAGLEFIIMEGQGPHPTVRLLIDTQEIEAAVDKDRPTHLTKKHYNE